MEDEQSTHIREPRGNLMEKPSILIVDDEDAVEKFKAGRFDVISMDMEMPRMGGLEALVEIRTIDDDIPIVFVTGFPRDAQLALDRGAAMVLHKPLHLRDLEEEVRGVMRFQTEE